MFCYTSTRAIGVRRLACLALVGFPLWVAPAPARSLPSQEAFSDILSTIVQGRDPAFGRAVAPALSLDTRASPAERAAQIVARLAREIETVMSAFADAPDADRIARTKAAVVQFSPETARDGASRSFEGNGPALSVMRQVLFVPAKSAHRR